MTRMEMHFLDLTLQLECHPALQTSQQLGRYLDIKIKLGRAGSMSSTSAGRVQQPKLQVEQHA